MAGDGVQVGPDDKIMMGPDGPMVCGESDACCGGSGCTCGSSPCQCVIYVTLQGIVWHPTNCVRFSQKNPSDNSDTWDRGRFNGYADHSVAAVNVNRTYAMQCVSGTGEDPEYQAVIGVDGDPATYIPGFFIGGSLEGTSDCEEINAGSHTSYSLRAKYLTASGKWRVWFQKDDGMGNPVDYFTALIPVFFGEKTTEKCVFPRIVCNQMVAPPQGPAPAILGFNGCAVLHATSTPPTVSCQDDGGCDEDQPDNCVNPDTGGPIDCQTVNCNSIPTGYWNRTTGRGSFSWDVSGWTGTMIPSSGSVDGLFNGVGEPNPLAGNLVVVVGDVTYTYHIEFLDAVGCFMKIRITAVDGDGNTEILELVEGPDGAGEFLIPVSYTSGDGWAGSIVETTWSGSTPDDDELSGTGDFTAAWVNGGCCTGTP